MLIIREDLVKGGCDIAARYSSISTSMGSAFSAGLAETEASKLGGRVETVGGPLSGRATYTVCAPDGAHVARYSMEWPVEDGD